MSLLDLGSLRQFVTLETPTTTPDGQGGVTQTWATLSPGHAYASIVTATQQVMTRLFANTVTGRATHMVTMRFHPDVTLQTRLTWTDRAQRVHQATVLAVQDIEGRGEALALLVAEVVS